MTHTISSTELAQLREAIYNAISDDQPYIVKCKAALTLLDTIAARTQEPVAWGVDWGKDGDRSCVSIVKKHLDGTLEVVAVEYSPQPAAVPDGMVLVPVEPTDEMEYAFDKAAVIFKPDSAEGYVTNTKEAYKAMLAALPKEATK